MKIKAKKVPRFSAGAELKKAVGQAYGARRILTKDRLRAFVTHGYRSENRPIARRLIGVVLMFVVVLALAGGLTACGDEGGSTGGAVTEVETGAEEGAEGVEEGAEEAEEGAESAGEAGESVEEGAEELTE